MSDVVGQSWLIDERKPIDDAVERQIERSLPDVQETMTRGPGAVPPLALLLHNVVVHDVRRWFGKTDVRLDALIVHGYGHSEEPASFYAPQTFRFPRIGDETELQIGEGGLLLFHGKPLHFLDISVTLSRDRKDSDSLSELLRNELNSNDMQQALGVLTGLAVAAPQVAVVTAAIGAAAVIGDFAYRLVRDVAGSTIGLYRNTWLQHRDGFGVGRHPQRDGRYTIDDFSFWYEVVVEKDAAEKAT
jgi:hypothetical protein